MSIVLFTIAFHRREVFTAQTILSIAVIVLLTVAVLNSNRVILDSDATYFEEEAMEIATSQADELLGEITSKRFDQLVNDTLYHKKSAFTLPTSLGPDAGESISPIPDVAPFRSMSVYNDVDDYNGYSRTYDNQVIPGFLITVNVYYTNRLNPDVVSLSSTYLKRVDVTVTNSTYLNHPIKFSTLAMY